MTSRVANQRAQVFTSMAAVWNDLHVRYSGVLDRIAGMVVGTPFTFEGTDGGPGTLREVVLDVLGDRDTRCSGTSASATTRRTRRLPLRVRAEVAPQAAHRSRGGLTINPSSPNARGV